MSSSRGRRRASCPDRTAAPGRSRADSGLLFLLVGVLLAAAIAGFLARGTAAPRDAEAPAGVFSAERAADAVAAVVSEPRPIGSPANDAAHRLLSDELGALGFDVTTHETIGAQVWPNGDRADATVGYVRNLVATRPGTDPTGTIVLATHIDSVAGAPGAADAGVGLAVILETVRALGADAQRNDLVVLLVDGEEDGLLGAEAYVRERADELAEPVVVLNHEARGSSGRPVVARSAGPMQDVLAAMPRPEAESLNDALFELLPNGTDFSEYREAGWWGIDMALVGDAWTYHSPQDDAAHLAPSSVQHFGDLTLALTRDLGMRDLGALSAGGGERPVLTTLPWGIVALPPGLVAALGTFAPLAMLATLVVRRRRRVLTLRGTGLGAAGGLLMIVLGVLLPVLLWSGASLARPQMLSQVTGDPVHAVIFFAAELAAAAAGVGAVWVLLRRWISRAALATGTALTATFLVGAVAWLSPPFGGWLALPLAITALAVLFSALLPRAGGTVAGMLAMLVLGWSLGQQASALGEFGIASSAGMLAGTAVIVLASAAPLVLVGTGRESARATRHGRRSLVPLGCGVLAVLLAGAGIVHTSASGEPVQERVTAQVDGDARTTTWDVTGRTAWGREQGSVTAQDGLPAPSVEVAEQGAADDGRRVVLLVQSVREAPELDLEFDGVGARDVTVDGSELSSTDPVGSILLVGVRPGQVARVEVTLDNAAVGLTLTDRSHDLAAAPGWTPPPDDVAPVHPSVRVSTTVDL